MLFYAYGGCERPQALIEPIRSCGAKVEGTLYKELGDPEGVGLLLFAEDPDLLAGPAREILARGPFAELAFKPEFAMIGRTYASGYEENLEDHLIHRPRRLALDPAAPWAVWYPLRRKGEFSRLPEEDQRRILGEHSAIGRSYGMGGHAADIRLACHGLDKNDNDFVIGLVGAELFPLSRLVQDMRKTEQTACYMRSMGPFFVGKAYWQSPL
jgi:chlorite dismutase